MSSAQNPGFKEALLLFNKAAIRVPAYKDFLKKHGIRPADIKTVDDFRSLPIIDKDNYIKQYSLPELCLDGNLAGARQLPMSSGSSGVPNFWPAGEEQDDISNRLHDEILDDVFALEYSQTLYVLSFGLGGWKAGTEFLNAARNKAHSVSGMTIITPGLDVQEVVRQTKMLSPYYRNVVLVGYPPFVRDILIAGTKDGISWDKFNLHIICAGESVSEIWRGRIAELAGIDDVSRVVNVYGMAEMGILGYETPLTMFLRGLQSARGGENIAVLTGGVRQFSLYQYDPECRYLEVDSDDTLLLTAPAGIPLVRYKTRDRGGVFPVNRLQNVLAGKINASNEKNLIALAKVWRRPMVYLAGRDDLSVTYYGLNVYPDNIKAALEAESLTSQVTGIFTMETVYSSDLEQNLQINIELQTRVAASEVLMKKVIDGVVVSLKKLNSEYAKLYGSIGSRAAPIINLVPQGTIGYVPGRKHKWVKRG